MSKQTDTSLFITSSLPRFYQVLLGGVESYKDLGSRIVNEIKLAQDFRQVEKVVELSRVLANIPIKEYQLIGQYYLVWSKCKDKEYDATGLEKIIDQTSVYKAQALLTRGTFEYYKRSGDTALYFYNEALKARPNISQYISISLAVAIIKSLEGFHKLALKDLEKLIPIIKYAGPKLYYDFLNSLAVELGEVGHKYEAQNIIKPVLESPLIIAYPEWQETAEELKEPNRSFVFIEPLPARMGKLLSMPVVEYVEPTKQARPAPIVNLESWKAKMGKKKNDDKNLEGLDSRQLLLKLMELGTAQGMTDDKLLKVIELMEKLLTEPQKPDDDEPGA